MYRVLLVDDERIVKLAIKSMIQWEALGLELAGTASNGISALQMIEKTKPDIIITDIKMPGMDGVELIRKLKEMEYDGEILVLSNYNDFELVREAMRHGAYDYVLKVTVKSEDFTKLLKELLVKLEKKKGSNKNAHTGDASKNSHREFLLRQIFSMEKGDFSVEARELSTLYAVNSGDSLAVFVFKAIPGERAQSPLKLEEALESITEEFLAKSNWHTLFGMDRSTVLLIVSYGQANISLTPQSMAKRLTELLETYFNIRSGLVYSEPVADYEQLFAHARKCIRISELFFYTALDGKVLSMGAELIEDEQFPEADYAETVEKICRDLVNHEPVKVLEHFGAVIKLASERSLNPYCLKKRIKKVIREADRRMIHNGYCSEEIFDLYPSDEDLIYTATSQIGLMSRLESLISKAQTRISAAGLNYRKEVREAVEYIERHIAERIMLSDIARYVNLNDTYLCKVFKEDTGKSIVSYINELKMKKAYELLHKGNKMIKEAAAAVGIDDQFYFNRLFKKVYGITPKEIKNK